MKPILRLAVCLLVLPWCSPLLAQGSTYVSGLVPDWNQPYAYPSAYDPSGPGPDPNPGGVSPWDAWCTPTSAAMLAGHWDDVHGVLPVAGDGIAEGNQQNPASRPGGAINWGVAPGWHDYTADGTAGRPAAGMLPGGGWNPTTDIGWYMNTDDRGDQGLLINPGGAHVGTFVGNCAEGLNNFFAGQQTPLAAQTTYLGLDIGGQTFAQIKLTIQTEINANRTLLGHFRWWVNPQSGVIGGGAVPPWPANESQFNGTTQFGTYSFTSGVPTNPSQIPGDEQFNNYRGEEGLGHTVVIVAYTTDGLGAMDGLVAHDNWGSTVRDVKVLFNDPNFTGQDGFPALAAITTVVPEPCALTLLAAAMALAGVRRRR